MALVPREARPELGSPWAVFISPERSRKAGAVRAAEVQVERGWGVEAGGSFPSWREVGLGRLWLQIGGEMLGHAQPWEARSSGATGWQHGLVQRGWGDMLEMDLSKRDMRHISVSRWMSQHLSLPTASPGCVPLPWLQSSRAGAAPVLEVHQAPPQCAATLSPGPMVQRR